jgi:hypothetical protein
MSQQLLRELERTRDETLDYFSLDPRDLARAYRPGKWSVRYILHHLADNETVFFERIRRALSEPRPVVWVMDQDAWAKGARLLAGAARHRAARLRIGTAGCHLLRRRALRAQRPPGIRA